LSDISQLFTFDGISRLVCSCIIYYKHIFVCINHTVRADADFVLLLQFLQVEATIVTVPEVLAQKNHTR